MATMREAEKKENFRGKLIMSAITVIVFLIAHFTNTDLGKFVNRAGAFANIVGVLLYAATVCSLWLTERLFPKADIGAGFYRIAWAAGTAIATIVSAGFNFDYFGL